MLSKNKILSLLLGLTLTTGTMIAAPVSAAQDNIEIILTDVTKDNENTLLGEAKIKVSVKGAGGNVSLIQTAMEFDGDLKYKSIDFIRGENNPPKGFVIPPNAALANATGELLPSITATGDGVLKLTDEAADLFILTFAGEPGDKVSLSLNTDSAAGTYCVVDGKEISVSPSYSESEEATASTEDNEGIEAVVRLKMDAISNFSISNGDGYADSKITLTITNQDTKSTISTVLNTVADVHGGHIDSEVSDIVFVVKNTVLAGDKYTVTIKGNGYVDYVKKDVDFTDPLILSNADFVPGDVNHDGKVDSADKTAFEEIKNGEYSDYADFNRDKTVNDKDDIFKDMDLDVEEETKTAPAKMSKPSVSGGEEKITVSWTAPSNGGSDITGYVIKYGKSKDSLSSTETADAGATSKTISDLKEDTTYYVQIAAKNAIGTGEYSDIASATTDEEDGGGSGGSGGGGGGGGGGFSPAPITPVTPVVNPNEPFTDLAGYEWAKESIYTLKNKGIISGVSSTSYAPANNIRRADFILILTRMLGINDSFTENFADVAPESYYYNAVGSAKAAGIAQGSGNSFMPENTITRQDLITLAYRAFLAKGYIAETTDLTSLDAFADKDTISEYARTAMASMVSAGIIQGNDGKVNPLGNATRAEVAVMCARLVNLIK